MPNLQDYNKAMDDPNIKDRLTKAENAVDQAVDALSLAKKRGAPDEEIQSLIKEINLALVNLDFALDEVWSKAHGSKETHSMTMMANDSRENLN